MGIFNRKKQISQKESNQNESLNELEALKKARLYADADKIYILLSTKQADMKNGMSIPYIGAMQNGQRILFMFSSYELAKRFVDLHGYERLDGIYPIGLIEKTNMSTNLKSILNIALISGIRYIDFDNVENADVFGCEIKWFMQANNISTESVSMILSEKEYKRITEENDTNIKLHFNPIPIIEFTDMYNITEERKKEILLQILKEEPIEDSIDFFINQESLFENCYIMDSIATKMLPQAIEAGEQNEIEFFSDIMDLLSRDKVFKLQTLYTLKKSGTNDAYIKNESAYLLYTDRFKYQGHFEYVKLEGISEFQRLIKNNSVKHIVVTNGPDSIAVLEAKLFQDTTHN